MPTHRFLPGSSIAERFRVQSLLGEGAMGTVYEAVDAVNECRCAVKVMRTELAEEPAFNERFLREATIGQTIRSPHVVRVFETGIEPSHRLPYLVMELLCGSSLQDRMRAPPPISVRRRLLDQLFEALAAAHRQQVVHRDLKPENLFVVEQPGDTSDLRVLDFGVAKVVRESTLGATEAGLGTPMWVAPEQGSEGVRIKPSADVWALGLLSFWLLTGKMFWLGANEKGLSTFDLALEILRKPIPSASSRADELGVGASLPAGFDAWFARCVHRDAEQRFANAEEAARGLRGLFAAQRSRHRLRIAWIVTGIAVVLAAVIAVLSSV